MAHLEVEVVEKHPFDGPLVVKVAGEDRTLGERVARQIYVTRRGRQTVDGESPANGGVFASQTQRKQA